MGLRGSWAEPASSSACATRKPLPWRSAGWWDSQPGVLEPSILERPVQNCVGEATLLCEAPENGRCGGGSLLACLLACWAASLPLPPSRSQPLWAPTRPAAELLSHFPLGSPLIIPPLERNGPWGAGGSSQRPCNSRARLAMSESLWLCGTKQALTLRASREVAEGLGSPLLAQALLRGFWKSQSL